MMPLALTARVFAQVMRPAGKGTKHVGTPETSIAASWQCEEERHAKNEGSSLYVN